MANVHERFPISPLAIRLNSKNSLIERINNELSEGKKEIEIPSLSLSEVNAICKLYSAVGWQVLLSSGLKGSKFTFIDLYKGLDGE